MIISILFVSCATHIHTVGYGPQKGINVTARQYYILWGLVPINSIDTNDMAGVDLNGKQIENYEIQTQIGPIDIALSIGLAMFTWGIGPWIIQSRTVTVTK